MWVMNTQIFRDLLKAFIKSDSCVLDACQKLKAEKIDKDFATYSRLFNSVNFSGLSA